MVIFCSIFILHTYLYIYIHVKHKGHTFNYFEGGTTWLAMGTCQWSSRFKSKNTSHQTLNPKLMMPSLKIIMNITYIWDNIKGFDSLFQRVFSPLKITWKSKLILEAKIPTPIQKNIKRKITHHCLITSLMPQTCERKQHVACEGNQSACLAETSTFLW